MFRIGQKVVCVDDRNLNLLIYLPTPVVKGRIYTISGFGMHADVPDMPCVHLEEFPGRGEPFGLYRFRPIVERKTDISFAHEILRKVTRKDRVRA